MKLTENETAFEAAKRECMEETNIILEKLKLLVISISQIKYNKQQNVIYNFVQEIAVKDNHERHYE